MVRELVKLLGSFQTSRSAALDCILLLSDLLESAITTDAANSDPLPGSKAVCAALIATHMVEGDGLKWVIGRLRSSNPKVRPTQAQPEEWGAFLHVDWPFV